MGLFGKSRKEVWQDIAQGIKGEFHEGGMLKTGHVTYHYKKWTVYLDDYHVQAGNVPIIYTRVRVPFINTNDLEMNVHKMSIFSNLAKKLGGQDILIGDAAFDEEWILKGNNEELVKNLLKRGTIRQLIMDEEKLRVEIKKVEGKENKQYRSTESQLTFLVQDQIKDEDRIRALMRLVQYILDAFVALGITPEKSPQSKY